MIDARIRSLILSLIRLFYPRLELHGREQLPGAGPIIFVINHPNAVLDPLLLMLILDRRITFLVKSTLFRNPVTRLMLNAFGALPVYRQQDRESPGASANQGPARNEQTFARCRALLRQGQLLALFPEGETHSSPTMLPLKTGAARIALSAEHEAGWRLGLTVVPVGLWYANKTRFRSAVLLMVGEPLRVAGYEAAYAVDQRQAAQLLTARIAEGLSQVVLQAEDAGLLHGTASLAAWTATEDRPPTLAQLHQHAAALLALSRRLAEGDLLQLRKLGQQVAHYHHNMRSLGMGDPWQLEPSAARRLRLAVMSLALLTSLPLAAAGFVLSYLPYRLTRLLAPRFVRHPAQLGTSKLGLGTVLMLAHWLTVAALVARRLGRWRGLLLLLAAPALSYIALLWAEGWRELRELFSLSWPTAVRARLAGRLIQRRRQLRAQIAALLSAHEGSPAATSAALQQEPSPAE